MNDKSEQLKQAELMIAKEIKRICEKYDITYILDAGSMLGAVRHDGFIPWDDDIDIGMPKKDYERFLSVAQEELGKDYFVDNYYTNNENPSVFTKVRLLGTKYIEYKAALVTKHNEIFVDIFPYYYISDNIFIRNVEAVRMRVLAHLLLIKGGFKAWRGENILKRIKFIPLRIISCVYSVNTIKQNIEKLYNKYEGTENLCIHDGNGYGYWYFNKEMFNNLIDIRFENDLFKIPKNYDEFLKKIYGDYMTIPPENERRTHQIVELDLGKYSNDILTEK